MTGTLFILFETAYGYSLFERIASDEIGQSLDSVAMAMQDLGKFGRVIKLKAFIPFKNAAEALQNINEISEGMVGSTLKNFLESNLPGGSGKDSLQNAAANPSKSRKKHSEQWTLGVVDKNLAASIKAEMGIECIADESVLEIIRGLRLFGQTLLKQFREGDLEKAQLGLGHSYSRAKVKFNVHRSDNMIIQASALLDQLDKDINTFAMRMREWYSWHFPELARLVPDHRMFAKLALAISDKNALCSAKDEEHSEEINSDEPNPLETLMEALEGDEALAKLITEAARSSMGTDIGPIDMLNIKNFARRVLALSEYRIRLHGYLTEKMDLVAPNLAALIGEMVGARLISHAGSLTNLSKFPASTVQILGAEKALFRALKSRQGKTPKYGLIYHAGAIGKAAAKNKGRISRYLANKCAIASRLDCFMEVPTNKFGEALRAQVEERLEFYEKGTKPSRNADIMSRTMSLVEEEAQKKARKAAKKAKKTAKEDSDDGSAVPVQISSHPEPPKKKEKSSLKGKKAEALEENPPVEKTKKEKSPKATKSKAVEAEQQEAAPEKKKAKKH